MEIKVEKEFKHEGTKYEPGETVDIPDDSLAKNIINKGFAHKTGETPEIEPVESEESPSEGGRTEEEIKSSDITQGQNDKLHVLYDKLDIDKGKYLKQNYDVEHTNELTKAQAIEAIDELQSRYAKKDSEKREGKEIENKGGVETKTQEGNLKQMVTKMSSFGQSEREASLQEPVAPAEKVKEVIEQYKEIVSAIIDMRPTQKGGDVMYIDDNGSAVDNPKRAENTYITRSGSRKLALATDLDMEIIDREKEWREDEQGKYYLWRYRVKVTHPKGRYIIQDGVCTSRDPFFTKGGRSKAEEQDVMHKALTVAYNRAILDLIGVTNIAEEDYYQK